VTGKDKDEGGIVVGGISFGVTGHSATVNHPEGDASKAVAKVDAGPVELDSSLMPLRVVAVTDLVPRAEHNAGAHAPEHPLKIEPTSFDELFDKLQPKCAMEIESVLADGKPVRVDFAPRGMKDFRPDGLARELPVLRCLLDGRRVLEQLREGSTSVEAAGSELARLWNHSSFVAQVLGGVAVTPPPGKAPAPAPAASTSSEADVSRILDMVDMGTPSSAESTAAAAPAPSPSPSPSPSKGSGGRYGAFIAAVAHSGKDKPGARPDEGIALIEKAFGLQLGAILQHPEFRRLETAWRGLHLLASRTPKTGVKLEVINARPDEEAAALQRAIDSAPGIEPPVSFAVVDIEAGSDPPSLARLRAIADVGEANVVPVITNAGAALFGHEDLTDIDRLDNKQALFEAPARAPWRAEANRPAMLWVSMAMNRILGRAAYDKRTSRIREASISEQPADDDAMVWLSPCWGVAALAIRSFDKYGWPCGITGARNGGVLEDLPVRDYSVPGTGETVAIPTEVFFSTETQRALGRLGVLALAAQPNNDATYLLTAATGYVPPPKRTMTDESAEAAPRLPQAPLGDQLFVARLAQFLQELGARIGAGSQAADVEKVLRAAVAELFEVAPPPGPDVTIDVHESNGKLQAAVTVRPRRFLGVGMEEITLGVPL
jgi:type VI secretion system protein ImpC